MPIFRYTAVNRRGESISGEVDARDLDQARADLQARGLEVRTLAAAEAVTAGGSAELGEHLVGLAQADLPLGPGLLALAAELPDGRLAASVRALAAKIEAGMPLPAAIDSLRIELPEHLRVLLVAGSVSGRMSSVVEDFLEHERIAQDVRRRIWPVVAYPLLLAALLSLWVLFVALWLVEDMRQTVTDFEIMPAESTESLFAAARGAPEIVALVWLGPPAVVLVLWLFGGRAAVHRAIMKVPLVGPAWRFGSMAEFSSLLAVLIDQRLPLDKALELTASGVRDGAVAEASRQVAARVTAGEPLAACVASTAPFAPTLAPLIAWGQRESCLPEALRAAADFFQQRVEFQTHLLRAVIPPLVFLVIAATVQWVVVGLFSPLLNIIQALS